MAYLEQESTTPIAWRRLRDADYVMGRRGGGRGGSGGVPTFVKVCFKTLQHLISEILEGMQVNFWKNKMVSKFYYLRQFDKKYITLHVHYYI